MCDNGRNWMPVEHAQSRFTAECDDSGVVHQLNILPCFADRESIVVAVVTPAIRECAGGRQIQPRRDIDHAIRHGVALRAQHAGTPSIAAWRKQHSRRHVRSRLLRITFSGDANQRSFRETHRQSSKRDGDAHRSVCSDRNRTLERRISYAASAQSVRAGAGNRNTKRSIRVGAHTQCVIGVTDRDQFDVGAHRHARITADNRAGDDRGVGHTLRLRDDGPREAGGKRQSGKFRHGRKLAARFGLRCLTHTKRERPTHIGRPFTRHCSAGHPALTVV